VTLNDVSVALQYELAGIWLRAMKQRPVGLCGREKLFLLLYTRQQLKTLRERNKLVTSNYLAIRNGFVSALVIYVRKSQITSPASQSVERHCQRPRMG